MSKVIRNLRLETLICENICLGLSSYLRICLAFLLSRVSQIVRRKEHNSGAYLLIHSITHHPSFWRTRLDDGRTLLLLVAPKSTMGKS